MLAMRIHAAGVTGSAKINARVNAGRILGVLLLLSQLTACGMFGGGSGSGGGGAGKGSKNQEFNSAVIALRSENWPVAERKLLALRKQYPDSPGIMINLGIMYQNLERDSEAEPLFREAIAVSSDVDAYNLLGVSLRRQGRFSEALSAYQDALAIDPEHADTHRNIGILYDVYLGEPVKAKRHYLAYQSALPEPDERVAGWVTELEHRSRQAISAPPPTESQDEQ